MKIEKCVLEALPVSTKNKTDSLVQEMSHFWTLPTKQNRWSGQVVSFFLSLSHVQQTVYEVRQQKPSTASLGQVIITGGDAVGLQKDTTILRPLCDRQGRANCQVKKKGRRKVEGKAGKTLHPRLETSSFLILTQEKREAQ
eukprot:scaffold185183_cov17-Tisochrysis_lutea.AAC.1